MELRDYQQDAFTQVRNSIGHGLKRPIVAAPTSFGKTILAGAICQSAQRKGKKAWFFCDRIQLIEQSIEKFTKMGIDFGVRQANHPLSNEAATVQIVSIQTIAAMVGKHGKRLPEFDLAIIDECHTQYEIIDTIMELYNNIPIIGLTATPYSKGLGTKYNNLIVPITQKNLLERDCLCPVRYYGGEHINLKNVRSNNANTFNPGDLAKETDADADRLVGCIVRNWLEYGENSQTIAFSPTQNMSKALVERLNASGITAEHIDCYHDTDERKAMFAAHDRGEFKVLSCSRLLNTGYDAPLVRCVIDCFPVKSVTSWVQRVGRLMRTSEGKQYAIYLDHANNFSRFGPAEDIVPTALDNGKKGHNEREQTNIKEKKIKTQECPECHQEMVIPACKACGYQLPVQEVQEDDGSMLVELTGKKANKKDPKPIKEQFLSELLCHARKKGYKRGWAANQYREKYGVWPNKINSYHVDEISDLAKGWLKHRAIAYANSQKKAG